MSSNNDNIPTLKKEPLIQYSMDRPWDVKYLEGLEKNPIVEYSMDRPSSSDIQKNKYDAKPLIIFTISIVLLAWYAVSSGLFEQKIDVQNPSTLSVCDSSKLTYSESNDCKVNYYWNMLKTINVRIAQVQNDPFEDTFEDVLDNRVKLVKLVKRRDEIYNILKNRVDSGL